MHWLIHSSIALILYGFWAFFPKLVSNYITPKDAIIIESVGIAVFGFIFWIFYKNNFQVNFYGSVYAILTGVAGMLGTLFFLYALSKGKASIIVTMTAMYPLITIFLSRVFLKETISLKQWIGILLALLAMYFLSSK